jgi:putative tricarboxylic transport membrane protein
MSGIVRERLAGTALLVAALVWVGLVYWTIPPSQDTTPGPRVFPLWLGLALAALAVAVIARTFVASAADGRDESGPVTGLEVWSVVSVIALTVLYGTVMEKLGFLVATTLFVAVALVVLLRITRPLFVASMALGMSVGAYLLFSKLLGTYLPPGTWISVYF